MKRRFIMLLAIIFIFAFAAPTFAAPTDVFADVPANHWAYGAIKQLAKAGIVEGYGDGTFRGQNTVTRYEMAIIIANAMTKVDKADAQQKALIEKLTAEFNQELVKIGARVAKLEANQPGLKIGGQARFTYTYRDDKVPPAGQAAYGYTTTRNNYETYRFRLEGTAKYGDNLTFFGRLRAQDYDVATGTTNTGSGSMSQVFVEQFWFNWRQAFNIENVSLTAGRQGLLLGKGGVVYAVGGKDLLMADYVRPEFNVKVALKNNPAGAASATPYVYNRELYTQLGFNSKDSHFTIYNVTNVDNTAGFGLAGTKKNLSAIAVDVKFEKVAFFGEYARNSGQATLNKIYWFGVTNGNPTYHPGLGLTASWAKPSANAQSLIYRRYEANAQSIYESQLNAVLGDQPAGTAGALWLQNTKGWEFYDQRTVAKNVILLTQIGQAKDIVTGQSLSTYVQTALYMAF